VFITQSMLEVAGLICAVLLTLAVFSRLVGDNALFRFALSLFIGTACGYILALVLRSVLWPRLLLLIQSPGQYWYYGIFFALGILLLARGIGKTSILANLPLGILFGIGAALAIGGSLAGTLIPQTRALYTTTPSGEATWLAYLNLALVLIGSLAVLGYFQVAAPVRGPGRWLARGWSAVGQTLGKGLVMVLLGALYAGVLVTSFTLLVGRLSFLHQAVVRLLETVGIL
jgi:hypothetical protein